MTILKIQFTTPAKGFKPVSRLIRWYMGTDYSHVLARWDGARGTVPIVWEAAQNAVRFLGPIAHKGRYVVHKEYEFDLDKEQYFRLIQFTHRYAHVDYGRWQLVGMMIAIAFNLKKNPFSTGKNEMVCSEGCGRLLSYVFDIELDIDLDIKGPDKLDKWIEKKISEGKLC